MSEFIRAVTNEQKNQRRQKILNAAKELFVHSEFERIKITDIAAKAGVSKGTVFLYFQSKEELFICLTILEYDNWHTELKEFLLKQQPEQCNNADKFLSYLEKNFLGKHTLIRLLAISNTILEKNISYEEALEYKNFFNDRILELGNMLNTFIPGFHNNDGPRFMMYGFAFITGLYQMANPPSVIQDVLKNKEFPVFSIDFNTCFIELMRLVLMGLGSEKGKSNGREKQ